MAEREIRVADLPGMRAFFDAVAALLDVINAEDGPMAVVAAADRVRAEALGIGNDPVAVPGDDERPRAGEASLRAAVTVARANPGYMVNVDWTREL